MNHHVAESTLKLFSELLSQGLRVTEIAEKTGFSKAHVYLALKQSGADYKTRKPEETDRLVLEAYRSGLRPYLIAKKLGRSYDGVYESLKRSGITFDKDNRTPPPFIPEPYEIQSLDPIWAAEFRGFFYGEGCARMDNNSGNFRPILTIGLRADDIAILEEIQSKLGGTINEKPEHHKNPNAFDGKKWAVTGWSPVRSVIEATSLLGDRLSAKKRQDVSILYRAIIARYEMPMWFTPEQRSVLADYRLQLQQVKHFQL